MQTVTVIVAGLVALGVLIFVHELGHFLVAKLAGIRVEKFSLGFGRKLIGFRRGETEYLISVLPLGGYVKMAGENPREVKSAALQPGDYFAKPWWVRLLALLAGPGMNWVTAVVILGLLFWVGFSVPMAKPQVVSVEAGTPAAQAGLQPGDVVETLDGQPLSNWEKFSERLDQAATDRPGEPVTLGVQRQDRQDIVSVVPEKKPDGSWRLGIGIAPTGTNVIERVFVGTPAEMAGFKTGDRVTAIDGQPVYTKYDFQNLIQPHAGEPVRITVVRDGRPLDLNVTPIAQQVSGQGKIGVIGVSFLVSDRYERVHYPFGTAFGMGFTQTAGISKMILVSLWQMITGQISATSSLGGPITIMRMAGQEARAGVKDFLFFLAGISIMLAIVNLLPIPVLDGGNAVFFIIEGIIGRPVSIRIQEIAQQAGVVVLVAIMVFALYNDFYRLVAPALGGGTP